MDAASPALAGHPFEVVMCRHLLRTLPEPAHVLARWRQLLAPTGRVILIEGFWMPGAGLKAEAVIEMLAGRFVVVAHVPLSDNSLLWGTVVPDERYTLNAMAGR